DLVLSIVDAQAPVITIQSPLNNTFANDSIWFNVTLDKAGSWCGYSLDDAANVTMDNDSLLHFYGQDPSVPDGTHPVVFFCNDTYENMNNTAERVFQVDVTPPSFNDPIPANGSRTNTNITLNASDATSGLAYINYSVNGSLNVTSATISLSSLTEGVAVSVDIYAVDNAGNINHTQYMFTKDTTAPLLTINLPVNDTEITENSTELNYTVDESPRAIWYAVDGIEGMLSNSTLSANTTINFTDVAGRHTLYLYANDSIGNLRTEIVDVRLNRQYNMSNFTQAIEAETGFSLNITGNITIDMTANDSVWLNQTVNMTLNQTNTIVVIENFNGLDASWIERFSINTTNTTVEGKIQNYGTTVGRMIHLGGLNRFLRNGRYNGTVVFSPFNSSSYTEVMYCSDDNADSCSKIGACAGNKFNGTSCYVDKLTDVTVYVPHFSTVVLGNDTIGPAMAIDAPVSPVANGFDVGVNVSLNEDANACNYSLNYSGLVDISMDPANAQKFTKIISAFLPDGDYNVSVACVDVNGNLNATSKVFTVLDDLKPVISGLAVSKTSSSATISWTTDEKADANVSYGTTQALGLYSNKTENTTTHSITLSLSASTTYYYNITSCDQQNNCDTTGPDSFTTDAVPANPDSGSSSSSGGSSPAIAVPLSNDTGQNQEIPAQDTTPAAEEEKPPIDAPPLDEPAKEDDAEIREQALNILSEVERIIGSLNESRDMMDAAAKLNEAKAAFDAGNYDAAKQLAGDALKLANEAKALSKSACPIMPYRILGVCSAYVVVVLGILLLSIAYLIKTQHLPRRTARKSPKNDIDEEKHSIKSALALKKGHKHARSQDSGNSHSHDLNVEINALLKNLSEIKPLLDSKNDTAITIDANNKLEQISVEIEQAKELMNAHNEKDALGHIKRGSRLLDSVRNELSDDDSPN
ncbi:MAG: hypothetical protein ABIG84_04435, partial [archaeon]